MMNTMIYFVLLLLFITGVIALQVFLSKSASKWPGLVLPMILFIFGLLFPLNMMAPSEGINAGFIIQMLTVWLLGNIPTIVMLAVYFACRRKGVL